MVELPDNLAVAQAYVAESPSAVWERVGDLSRWPELFGGWVASIEEGDDRFTATGPEREKFDLYPTREDSTFTLHVEVVDELGSADTLHLIVLEVPGGCMAIVTHGRLPGTSEAAWQNKRDSVASGLHQLSVG